MVDTDLKKRKLKMKLYINLACDILDIPTPYIHYRMPKNEPNNLGVTYKKRGYYHIYLNAEYPVEAILYNACLHECRHVYQAMVCERKDAYLIEPVEVINSWIENLTNYKDVFNKNYELQPVELDAYAFGDYVFNTMYNQEVIPRKEPLKTLYIMTSLCYYIGVERKTSKVEGEKIWDTSEIKEVLIRRMQSMKEC